MPKTEYLIIGMTDAQSRESAKSVCQNCKVSQHCNPQVYVELMTDDSRKLKVVGNNVGKPECELPSVLNSV